MKDWENLTSLNTRVAISITIHFILTPMINQMLDVWLEVQACGVQLVVRDDRCDLHHSGDVLV